MVYVVLQSAAVRVLTFISPREVYALGVAIRFGLHLHPESLPLYIVQNLFVVLSPCGFIAGEYVLLGRLAIWLKADQHMLVPPRKITLVFVLSDVSTFFIQVCRPPSFEGAASLISGC